MTTSKWQHTTKWLRIIAVNDIYDLANLPRLRTLFNICTNVTSSDQFSPPVPPVTVEHPHAQPDRTLVTLAGDFLSPSLLSSLDRGRGMVDVLNHVPITHLCFGNHEADLPIHSIKRRVREFNGVWLNTNMQAFEEDTVPYEIIDLGDDIHVGLLGLLTDQPGVFSTDTFRGVPILDVAVAAVDASAKMQQQIRHELAALIPLTHQSVRDDEKLIDTLSKNSSVPPIPVLLGGHEHELILKSLNDGDEDEKDEIDDKEQQQQRWQQHSTQLIKTGSDATHAVIADVFFKHGGGVAAVETTVVNVDVLEPDQSLFLMCEKHEETVSLMKGEVVIDLRANRSILQAEETSVEESTKDETAEVRDVLSSEGARRRQTTLGCVFASACREELQSECAMINGGPIKGERLYHTRQITYAQLQKELPFPTKMIVIPISGRLLRDSVHASRTGKEERGYLQLCDSMETLSSDSTMLTSVGGSPLDLDAVYNVALPRNLMSGFCGIQPLMELGESLHLTSQRKDSDAFVPALNLVLAYFAKDLWRRLGSWSSIDANEDGVIDEQELIEAFERRFGQAPSKPLLTNLLAAFDLDGSGVISRPEYERSMKKK